MMAGFDLTNPLVCEGIIGDGCGGGRIFFIEDEALQVYDPMTQKKRTLLQEVKKAIKIEKKACIITVTCEDEIIRFDLSQFNKI